MPSRSRSVRVLEVIAGLLSAGVLATGVLLAVLEAAAPAVLTGSGQSATEGPRWDRVLVPLLVGGGGELARRLRPRFGHRVRPAVAAAVVVLCLAALWWGWWR